jgi:hypothetical protein
VIHHVADDHLFKDDGLFYRFRRDDNTYQGPHGRRSGFRAPPPPPPRHGVPFLVLACAADTRAYRLLTRRAMHIHAAMHARFVMVTAPPAGASGFWGWVSARLPLDGAAGS